MIFIITSALFWLYHYHLFETEEITDLMLILEWELIALSADSYDSRGFIGRGLGVLGFN